MDAEPLNTPLDSTGRRPPQLSRGVDDYRKPTPRQLSRGVYERAARTPMGPPHLAAAGDAFREPLARFRPPPSRVVEQAQRRIRAAVHARRHAMPQSFNHLLAGRGTTPARLRRCPAVPGMNTIHVLPVEPVLEQPVRRRRPHLPTSTPLSLAPLLVRYPPVELPHGSRRLLHDHTAREAQQLQSGRLVAHTFDSTVGSAATTRAPNGEPWRRPSPFREAIAARRDRRSPLPVHGG